MGSEYFRNAFRPLLPEVYHFNYNDDEVLYSIDHNTAAVVVEMVQAESGVHPADPVWMMALKERCETAGALLIADEIQTGFGRTGTLFAFEQYGITPDILLLGKALGSGLPLGAFIASKDLMDTLSAQPVLGHITTFGGNPVCCAAGLAGFQELSNKQVINSITQKQNLFRKLLTHPRILAFRFAGLMMAIQFENESFNQKIIQSCLHRGLITDWFLFAPDCLRIAPPLIISDEDIRSACRIILESIDEVIR